MIRPIELAVLVTVIIPAAVVLVLSGLPLTLLQMALGFEVTIP